MQMRVCLCSADPVLLNPMGYQNAPVASTAQPANSTEGYLEPIAGDGPSTTAAESGRYLAPVDGSPIPTPLYLDLVQSPPSSPSNHVAQDSTGLESPGANSGYLIPSEDDDRHEHYCSLSVDDKSPEYTKLQLQNSDIGSSSTDPV